MKLKSVVRVFCALAIGLLPGVAHAQHSTGSYIQHVNLASGTVAVVSSGSPSAYTQPVTFTATVPSGATGTVTFFADGTAINTPAPVTISGTISSAITTISTLSVGTHSITATYSGDSNFTSATSTAISQVVGKGASGLTLASAPNPSNFGSNVTFTATLASTATGNVTFFDGGTSLGVVVATSGTASFSTTALTAGQHSITAVYAGDANFNGLTSNTVLQQVNKNGAVSPVLTGSPNPATYGTTVVFTATMPSNATGTVTFLDNGASIGTGTLTAGVATFSISTLTAGPTPHPITASYAGDANYAASVSNLVSETINKQTGETITLATSLTPAAFSTPVTFTATVPNGATGTVTFYDNGVSIGTGTVTAGVATYTTSTLSVGTHPISATYGGDTNYSSVSTTTATNVSQVISLGTATVAISGAPNPSTYGGSVLMTIIVTGQNGVIPTGSVTLMDGTTALGSALPLDGTGKATSSVSTLTAGDHKITATYSGDTNYK